MAMKILYLNPDVCFKDGHIGEELELLAMIKNQTGACFAFLHHSPYEEILGGEASRLVEVLPDGREKTIRESIKRMGLTMFGVLDDGEERFEDEEMRFRRTVIKKEGEGLTFASAYACIGKLNSIY